jgi:hypothetical protein
MKAVLCFFTALLATLSDLSVRAENDGETTPLRVCLNIAADPVGWAPAKLGSLAVSTPGLPSASGRLARNA